MLFGCSSQFFVVVFIFSTSKSCRLRWSFRSNSTFLLLYPNRLFYWSMQIVFYKFLLPLSLTPTSKSSSPLWDGQLQFNSPASEEAASTVNWMTGCNYACGNNRPVVSSVQQGSVLWLQDVPSCDVVFWLDYRQIQTWWLRTCVLRHWFIPLIHSGPGGNLR